MGLATHSEALTVFYSLAYSGKAQPIKTMQSLGVACRLRTTVRHLLPVYLNHKVGLQFSIWLIWQGFYIIISNFWGGFLRSAISILCYALGQTFTSSSVNSSFSILFLLKWLTWAPQLFWLFCCTMFVSSLIYQFRFISHLSIRGRLCPFYFHLSLMDYIELASILLNNQSGMEYPFYFHFSRPSNHKIIIRLFQFQSGFQTFSQNKFIAVFSFNYFLLF